MKIGPIQLDPIVFRHVHVELDANHVPEGYEASTSASFDFEGVNISTNVGLSPMDDDESPRRYFVSLRVVIDNSKIDDKDPRVSPYLIDVEAGAAARGMPGVEALPDMEDLVLVNSTSLLWSAIREQVCSLTARMPAGVAMLPAVSFLDLREQNRRQREEQALKDATPRDGSARAKARKR